MELILLAGGLGTRLRSAVPNLPKCMAPVNGKPFIHYVIEHFKKQGVTNFIFSLGYMHEAFEQFLTENFTNLNYTIVIEDEPLGTGGAILNCMPFVTHDNVIVTNADTLFKADIKELATAHNDSKAMCSLALKPMNNFNRYGTVTLENNTIVSFNEKQQCDYGLINGGIYCLNKSSFLLYSLPQKFSFEKEFLEKYVDEKKFTGVVADNYFIDIGIPQDYSKAQTDFKFQELEIDDSWTLFLDRDGVINEEKHLDYVNHWNEFIFYQGVKEATAVFAQKFKHIVVATNQRGVSKGLTPIDELHRIHSNMKAEIEAFGGRIDKIYFCTDADNESPNRKPNPGMAFQAQADFSSIDLNKSIMIGNNISDLKFGRNAGMKTVFLRTTKPELILEEGLADLEFESLISFAKIL